MFNNCKKCSSYLVALLFLVWMNHLFDEVLSHPAIENEKQVAFPNDLDVSSPLIINNSFLGRERQTK